MTTVTILGVTVQLLTVEQLNDMLTACIRSGRRRIIVSHNLHSVYLCHREPKLQTFYAAADVSHIDGMALVFWAKLLGLPASRNHRVTHVDWIDPLLALIAKYRWKVFYVGSKPEITGRIVNMVRQRFPDIEIRGHHGYFDPASHSGENQALLRQINRFAPHLLFVGMGMPRQEYWILDNLDRMNVHTILPCGALMDVVAGALPTPPKWVGGFGLHWFFRLLTQPRHIWRRCLIEPWFLLPHCATDIKHRVLSTKF